MPWLVWTYDPSPEGGWHIAQGADTQEAAVAAAKALHEKETQEHKRKTERMAARGHKLLFSFYAGVMVTPGAVFSLEAQK